eukprot:3743978-Prymnesium_polylepis.1
MCIRDRYQRGHVRPLQARVLLEAIHNATERGQQQRTYCELGFNAGHSSALALLSDPKIKVRAFDLMMFKYSWPAARLLNDSLGGRLQVKALPDPRPPPRGGSNVVAYRGTVGAPAAAG